MRGGNWLDMRHAFMHRDGINCVDAQTRKIYRYGKVDTPAGYQLMAGRQERSDVRYILATQKRRVLCAAIAKLHRNLSDKILIRQEAINILVALSWLRLYNGEFRNGMLP